MDLKFYLYNAIFEKQSGDAEPDKEVYNKWKKLVNMSVSDLTEFIDSEDGKKAGLSKEEGKEHGIHTGKQSAQWILKMLPNGGTFEEAEKRWDSNMWYWARRQNSFISRMLGNDGPLFDKDNNKTRKHTSLLIWGHNPKK